jgi:histidinol-phosphate aminotransferase/imidazoleglycerol-phosphate dehydratase/histidinol-phosphatase
MTSLAERLARPEILALPPLSQMAGSEQDHATGLVRLHLNENCLAPLAEGAGAANANRYGEPRAPALRRMMAALYGVEPGNLLVTRGADDAIDLLIRSFCRAGEDAISIAKPTFGAYALFAQIQGARVIEASLGADFAFDPERFIDRMRPERYLKLAFLCSPNNPTGNIIDPATVLRVADALRDTILVLDEAYIEYSDVASLAGEVLRRDNLVILRTLSKAYGLAGLRIGCAIGPAPLIDIIGRALPPFPLSSASVAIASAALDPSRRLVHAARITATRTKRDQLAGDLEKSPHVRRVLPSETNFLLIETTGLGELKRRFERDGICVRYRPDIGPGTLRLSIGSDEENRLVLAAFGVTSEERPARYSARVRDTSETKIAASVDLDSRLPRRIETGIGFFDHMLDQVAAHGGFSLVLKCEGDLHIDPHHSIEDCAIVLGEALGAALGSRRGIARFGFSLPMDEAEASVLIDLSGRPFCRFEGSFEASHIGQYPCEMTEHVFRSLSQAMSATIHVRVTGENDHHKTESCFKALGRALAQAIATGTGGEVPSTKGMLT